MAYHIGIVYAMDLGQHPGHDYPANSFDLCADLAFFKKMLHTYILDQTIHRKCYLQPSCFPFLVCFAT